MKKHITVTEFNFYIASIVSNEELLKNCIILGEVSGVSVKDNHLYFTLKDSKAALSVAFFNCYNAYIPKNGEKVLVQGSPDFYQKMGKFTFVARAIEAVGAGKLHLQLEALKQKLKEEGLFDVEHKREIPKFPKKIGVVTSAKGAVVKDIFSTIRQVNKIIDITVLDVKVQGEMAVDSICKGLKNADMLGLDVIILARGGGSFEELMPFNNERIARTIFNMLTPIISAVGHETDVTIADFVADFRAITPTAGAKLVAYNIADMKRYAINNLNRSKRLVQDGILNYKNRVQALLNQGFRAIENKGDKIISKLSLLNPAEIMKKGYFKAMKGTKNLNSIKDLKINDTFKLYGHDASVEAKVTKTNSDN